MKTLGWWCQEIWYFVGKKGNPDQKTKHTWEWEGLSDKRVRKWCQKKTWGSDTIETHLIMRRMNLQKSWKEWNTCSGWREGGESEGGTTRKWFLKKIVRHRIRRKWCQKKTQGQWQETQQCYKYSWDWDGWSGITNRTIANVFLPVQTSSTYYWERN